MSTHFNTWPMRTWVALIALVLSFAAHAADTPAPPKGGNTTNPPPFSEGALDRAFDDPDGWFKGIKLGMTAKQLGLRNHEGFWKETKTRSGEWFGKKAKKMSSAELLSIIQVTSDPNFKSLQVQPEAVYWYFRWQGPRSNLRTEIIFQGDTLEESRVIFTRLLSGPS